MDEVACFFITLLASAIPIVMVYCFIQSDLDAIKMQIEELENLFSNFTD